MSSKRVYLLSPANCRGRRAMMLRKPASAFELAMKLRTGAGAPLGDVFAFTSGLYFRGKLAYANRFAASWRDVLVIAPGRGLVAARTPITIDDLEAMADVPVDVSDERYAAPLRRDVKRLTRRLRGDDRAVLLGSIATDKYVSILEAGLGDRLCFPLEFVGRGDMSRGGLLLRCIDQNTPLSYIPVRGAERRGQRPPRLNPRDR
jgi:hypothetical protein